MTKRAWGLGAFAAIAAAPAMIAVGGCILDRNGAITQNCSSVADCDDQTPCTTDVCNAEGVCEHTPFAGTESLVQVPFDCNQLVCEQGRAVSHADDSDAPTNPCVEASCSEGILSQSNKPDGAVCTLGAGTGH